MKIFLDPRATRKQDFEAFINTHQDHQFVFDIDSSYDAEVIISVGSLFDNQKLELYPNLKWMALTTAGYDQIDLDYFKKRNIRLTYAKDVFSIQIAEDVFSKILYFNRNIEKHIANQKNNLWKFLKTDYEIYGSTIGIIGAGSIGKHIAERMKSFKTKVIGYKRELENIDFFDKIYTTKEGLYELLRESDYVICSIPLSSETRHLIDAKALSYMKSDALLINVARGDIIDQSALTKALTNKQIRGAALDVTTPEPLPKDHPLWNLDNCLITPHNASASPKINERIAFAIIDTLNRYINNLPLDNIVV